MPILDQFWDNGRKCLTGDDLLRWAAEDRFKLFREGKVESNRAAVRLQRARQCDAVIGQCCIELDEAELDCPLSLSFEKFVLMCLVWVDVYWCLLFFYSFLFRWGYVRICFFKLHFELVGFC